MHSLLTPTAALILAFLMGGLSACFAHRKGKNPYLWFAIGFLFGALGILAVFLASSKTKEKEAKPILPPQPVIQGPSNKFWYYLDPAHEQRGPMSFEAVLKAWKEGTISLTTYVWHEELPEWKLLKDLVQNVPHKA